MMDKPEHWDHAVEVAAGFYGDDYPEDRDIRIALAGIEAGMASAMQTDQEAAIALHRQFYDGPNPISHTHLEAIGEAFARHRLAATAGKSGEDASATVVFRHTASGTWEQETPRSQPADARLRALEEAAKVLDELAAEETAAIEFCDDPADRVRNAIIASEFKRAAKKVRALALGAGER